MHSLNHIPEEIMDGEITLREVIFSVFIIGILFFFGCMIHNKIANAVSDHNRIVEQTIMFSGDDMFKHCLETSPGNAFCEGDLDAVKPVSDWDNYIEGEYLAIMRRYQIYTKHTRVVHYTTGSGKNKQHHRRIEHYWTWDTHRTDEKKSDAITFCGIKFSHGVILGYHNWYHKGTFSIGHNKRYVYDVVDKHHHGTIKTSFRDKTISPSTLFFGGMKPDEVAELDKIGSWPLVLFWMLVVVVIGFAVFWFCMLNNRWLETKGKKKVVVDVGQI